MVDWGEHFSWYGARRLAERKIALQEAPDEAVESALAVRRWQRWQWRTPFTEIDGTFERRLAAEGLSAGQFFDLLGLSNETLRERTGPPGSWVHRLTEVYALTNALPTRTEDLQGDFAALIEPLVVRAMHNFKAALRSLVESGSGLQCEPEVLEKTVIAQVVGRLTNLLRRTLVLELHIAGLKGQLSGNDPQQRFRSFVDALCPEAALRLFSEYPVLARQVVAHLDASVAASTEVLCRLGADWQAIGRQFGLAGDLGGVVSLEPTGDSHNGGRSVTIVSFGCGLKLVYKPRSLAVDLHFQELLDWLNRRGEHPPFQTLRVLDCTSHGWTEFISAEACRHPAEVRRFYLRQGGYLAILYVLGASDCYYENWIACGEHPHLIDLECLFQGCRAQPELSLSEQTARSRLEDSVLRTGMLPQRLWSGRDPEAVGVDISGLNAGPGQLNPGRLPVWEEAGTDRMRLVYRRTPLAAGHNRPVLDGVSLRAGDYAEVVVEGFTAIYGLLLAHREAMMAPGGPLSRFARDQIRSIVRPTRLYSRLLSESYEPGLLRDALERELFFDRLWVGIAPTSGVTQAIAHERADLWRDDIPYFTSHPDARYLVSSTGTRIDQWFCESGLEGVHRRLEALGPSDLARQLSLIRDSFPAAVPIEGGLSQVPTPFPTEWIVAEPGRLLAAAMSVGERLRTLAIESEHDATWIAAGQYSVFGRVPFGLLGLDLYGGLPGIALFFAHLGALSGDPEYEALARRTVAGVRQQARRDGKHLRSIGGFCGWGGVIYALTQLGTLWDDRALLIEGLELAGDLLPLVRQDRHLDVVAGAAGCILGLEGLYERLPSNRLLAALIECGEHLLLKAQPVSGGIGWLTLNSRRPLLGYAHGAAGIASALLRLARLSGQVKFRDAARSAVAYERGLFSAHGNWPDLRDAPTTDTQAPGRLAAAWCHGAAGIGLARLQMLDHADAQVRNEVEAAVQATVAQGFSRGLCLCHGTLGCLDFLQQAAEALAVPKWRRDVYRLVAGLLPQIEDGSALGQSTLNGLPGLMDGLAGVGYGLLRLAAPDRVPCVLTLDGPGHHFEQRVG